MSKRKNGLLSLLTLLLLGIFSGCLKFDTPPQLEVIVLDSNDSGVTGAYVALFESETEWEKRINPVQAWRRTDNDGAALFNDLKENKYYVYARFNGLDNSFNGYATVEPLVLNQVRSIIIHIR
jgi:hypothetical protein